MSSIPTKQIDGDVAVGRNVSVGGNANIQGNARIGHNLKVEGWLEAKNIKGVNKGLFATAGALREAYPQPHDGWFAGVSATEADIAALGLTVQQGKALFRMYVGSGGEWVCEPIDKLYEIVVENVQVDNLYKILSILQGDHEALKSRVDAHDKSIAKNENDIKAVTNSKGASGGIAPLDDSSRVPLKHLPGRVDNVVEFRIIAEGIEPSEGMSHHYSGDDGCIVVFDKTTQCFLLGQPKMGQAEKETAAASDSGTVIPGGTVDPGDKVDPENPWVVEMIDLSKFNFFRSWMDCVSYGTYTANGRKPEGGKIYICQTEGALYRWNGLSLVQTGGGASSGEELKELDRRMKDAEAKLGAVIGQQAGLMFVNVNGIAFVDDPYMTMEEALAAVPEEYRRSGTIVTFLKWTDESCTDAVWETYQWKGYAYTEDEWEDTSTWKRLTSCAGSGTSGEVLHVEDIPALSAADLDRIIGNTAETNLNINL